MHQVSEQLTTPLIQRRTRADVGMRLDSCGGELTPGAVVGYYRVEELCGRGGFATVYRVRHDVLGRTAALKLLHPGLATSPSMLARFEREARTVARLGHPNTVEIYDFGKLPNGRPYFVMEWLEGHTLDDEIRARGNLSPSEALEIIEEVASTLDEAHGAGIVHRDLTPGNVFVTPTAHGGRTIKLIDFGLAKLVEPTAARLTPTDVRMGTPTFMAPEQLLGKPVGAYTDVYALGVMLYDMLTGQVPFDATASADVENMHLVAPVPPVGALAPEATACDAVIQRCMAKDPEARYASALEVVEALRRVVAPAAQREASDGLGICVSVEVDPKLEDWSAAIGDAVDSVERIAASVLRRHGFEMAAGNGNSIRARLVEVTGDTSPRRHVAATLVALRRAIANAGLPDAVWSSVGPWDAAAALH